MGHGAKSVRGSTVSRPGPGCDDSGGLERWPDRPGSGIARLGACERRERKNVGITPDEVAAWAWAILAVRVGPSSRQ